MVSAARRRATYEEVLRAPEPMVAEVIDGELRLQPRPARRHARASSRLGGELDGPFDRGRGGPGGWVLLDEPELHLGAEPHILVPDIAGWRRARMPFVEDGPHFDLAPDWVCEVLSPSTAAFDRGRKADVYLEVGVRYLWLLDAETPQIEAFEAAEGRWVRLGAYRESDARIVPFDAVPLDVPSLVEGVSPKR
jgi:Uma2 family endonuclease